MNWNKFFSQLQVWLNAKLFEIAGTPISVATVVTVVIIILLTFVISKLLQRATIRAFHARDVQSEGTAQASARLLHYVVLLVGFGIALQTVGVDLGALFAAGAIFAVGIGFAMQSIAQNFVSGVILLIERSIKPGDIVEVESMLVKVIQMGIRATIVETRDGENLIVPNSVLIQSAVKNYTFKDTSYRIRVTVGVSYESDMKLVSSTLRNVVDSVHQKWGTKDRAPFVGMTGFGDNTVNFEVGVWTTQPWEWRAGQTQIHEAVWWGLKDAGIEIAFPQVDVHFDAPVLDAIQSLRPQLASVK